MKKVQSAFMGIFLAIGSLAVPAAPNAPDICPPGTVFGSTVKVCLSAVPDARIRYTLDGSEPTARSAQYAGPLTLEESCTLQAAAWTAAGRSPIARGEFVRRPPETARKVILLTVDSMNPRMFEKLSLPRMTELIRRGALVERVVMPLPMHPLPSEDYPWNCSLPNPVLMSGSVLVGTPGLPGALIQHAFSNRCTAFTMNCSAYCSSKDNPQGHGVESGFSILHDLQAALGPRLGFEAVMQQDDLSLADARDVITRFDPAFYRIHLQGPNWGGARDREAGRTIFAGNALYRAANGKADALVGEFINWLAASGRLSNTVVFIMGDNGQSEFGWHPPYEPEADVTPLIIAGAGVKAGTRIPYAEHIDVAPTLCYLAGAPFPRYSQGRVIAAAFAGLPDDPRPERIQEQLNALLREHRAFIESPAAQKALRMNPEFSRLNDAFASNEQIATWHKRFNSPAAVLAYDQAALAKLRALVAEKK